MIQSCVKPLILLSWRYVYENRFSTAYLGFVVSAGGCNRNVLCTGPPGYDKYTSGACSPPMLTVEVRSEDGRRVAYARDLPQTADRPIARLTVQEEHLIREDLWPTESDIGQLIILPGGEVGKLIRWWNARDGSEWRWQVEFYNHR